ncbi:MAG TPA: iron-containing alcohol dehydrogenase, partial [SAR86 cluster bacterium]|nr:iron-containing alcohol dehydrogenase [SAR86 cluster bacterium]
LNYIASKNSFSHSSLEGSLGVVALLGSAIELRLHHGTLNGVILPTILRFNKDHVGDKYSKIARAMGKPESTDLPVEIEKLNEEIGLPSGLKDMGVTEDMIPDLVEHSMADPSNATTPRLPSKEEWEKLFFDAM